MDPCEAEFLEPEVAADCFISAWRANDASQAQKFASPDAVARLFEFPYTGEWDWEFNVCNEPGGGGSTGVSCWYSDIPVDPDFHGVGLELFMGLRPETGYFVEEAETYG